MTAAKKKAAAPRRRRATKTATGSTREVIFAIPQATEDGTDRRAGDRAEIPAAEARLLIRLGRARAAGGEAPQTADPGITSPSSPNGDGTTTEGTQS